MRVIVSKPTLPAQLEELTVGTMGTGVEFENGFIADVDWSAVEARRLSLETVRLEHMNMTAAKLRDGSWLDVYIQGSQGGGADLGGLTARRILIEGSRMSGCIMSEADLRDAQWLGNKLDMMNFRFAKLKNVIFKDCDLTEVDFSGANLLNILFQNCRLERANFDAATMVNVDLTSSQLLDLKGVTGLAGATIGYDQLAAMAPSIANELGIKLKSD